MLNTTSRNFRISKLHQSHATVNSILSAVGQTLAVISAAVGITVADAEKKLSILIDEGLCIRTVGGRATATYAKS